MHRPTVGIIALVLLLAGVGGLLLHSSDGPAAWQWGCIRVGLLMGAVWLAHPHLKGIHPRLVALAILAGVVIAVLAAKHPMQIALLAIILALLGYLRMKSRQPEKSSGRRTRPMRPSARG